MLCILIFFSGHMGVRSGYSNFLFSLNHSGYSFMTRNDKNNKNFPPAKLLLSGQVCFVTLETFRSENLS